mmetsp:Transcript_1671/g.3715  ORF Transcript_1671/g.3715 Transcript_1671/m.3715 type:complete len:828 (-) Transcript_1671:157-2640(-)
MTNGSEHSTGRRSSELRSPSYFRNVVPLGADCMSQLPETSPSKATRQVTTPISIPALPSEKSSKGKILVDNLLLRLPEISSNNNNNKKSEHEGLIPAASPSNIYNPNNMLREQGTTPNATNVCSRRIGSAASINQRKQHRRRRRRKVDHNADNINRCCFGFSCGGLCWCCNDRKIVRSTLSCMNVVAKILSWCTVVASVAGVVWYSYELKKTGKDPHLILWNSAAAFVLIGFPISIYGIVMHLSNYNQPETQVYIVRILFMVPLFSIQSWLGLRFKDYSIYFEAIRDFYEAYVLYSFLQFLIQVLGGEEALILMLKDKSPTRGVHIGGLQLCLKPWLMGQPVRMTYMNKHGETILTASGGTGSAITASETSIPGVGGLMQPMGGQQQQQLVNQPVRNKPLKRVYWTSPFFLQCKLGVLQYVLLKLASTIVILILEPYNLYKEGSFSYKGGYLYICILTNVSQTWALYCFFFFYFATKNELTPIRPVGKFLSVKLLVFFTWWQSLFISILYQMQLIPHYISTEAKLFGAADGEDLNLGALRAEPDWNVPLSAEDAAALDEYGGRAFWASPSEPVSARVIEYSPEDVAKALQDYLICIEMFAFAIVHFFVFPHSEYSPEAVQARARALNQMPNKNWNKRLGRKWKEYDNKSAWSGTTNTSRESTEIELFPVSSNQRDYNNQLQQYDPYLMQSRRRRDSADDDDLRVHPMDNLVEEEIEHHPLLPEDEDDDSFDSDADYACSSGDDDECSNFEEGDEEEGNSNRTAVVKKNFFSALLDSTIPQDLRDNTVGIIKGEYVVERKTLLHHAATSDSYDLLSRTRRHNNGVSLL